MKRLFNKHNPISRVVALWLVFVMMAVPFFSNSGLLSNPKANGGSGTEVLTRDVVMNMRTTDFEVTDGKVKPDDTSALSDIYYYGVSTVKVNAGDVVFKTGDVANETTSDYLTITTGTEGVDLKTYTITDPKIKIVTNNTGNFADELEADSLDLQDSADVSVNEYYAVYIMVTATDENDADCSYGKYVKMAYSQFVELNPFESLSASLVDRAVAGNDVSDDTWYTKTYIDGISTVFISNMHKAVGEFKYGYAKENGNITWKDVSTTFGDSNAKEEVVFEPGCEGTYSVYLGYFAGDTLIKQSDLIGTVNIDTKAPVINEATGLYYNPNGWTDGSNYTDSGVEEVTVSKAVRDDEKSKYRYYVVVDESGSGVTSTDVSVMKNSSKVNDVSFTEKSTNVFYVDAFVASTSTDTYSVQVEDGMGLTATKDIVVLLPVDTSKRDINLYWGKASEESNLPELPNGGAGNVVTDEIYKLKYAVTSYDKLVAINVKGINKDGNETTLAQNAYYDSTQPDAEPYYVYDFTMNVPYSDTNAAYTNLKVEFTFSNEGDKTETYTLTPSMLIDSTNPVFKDESDNNQSYSIPNTWNPTADEIKMDILSGETWSSPESKLIDAYYEVGGTKYSFISDDEKLNGGVDKVDDGVINIDNIPESTDTTGTPITIYAEDSAGNKTNDTVYYKKDITDPEFATTDPVYFFDGTKKVSTDGAVINGDYKVYAEASDSISGLASVEFQVFDANGDATGNSKSITDMSQLANGVALNDLFYNMADGSYTLKVTIKDNATNYAIKELSFVLDRVVPEATDMKVGTYDSVADSFTITTAPLVDVEVTTGPPWNPSTIQRKVYFVNPGDIYYQIKVSDNVSLTDPALVSVGNMYTLETTKVVDGKNHIYYIKIDTTKLSDSAFTDIKFKLVDTATNETQEITCPYALQFIDKDLSISATVHKVSDDSVVSKTPEELEKGTNEAYYVLVDISSGNPIDGTSVDMVKNSVSLGYEDTAYTSANNSDSATSDEYGRYHYYKKFVLPTSSNNLFEDIKVTGGEISGTPESIDLMAILYDKTTPLFFNEGSTTEVFSIPTEWANSVSGNILVTPGNSDIIESDIVEATYIIEGDTNPYPIQINGDGTASGAITTPADFSSSTTDGTVITIHAEDAADNSHTETYRVKVDAKAPTVDSIAVAGNPNITASTAPLNTAPTITAKVTDNLTVDYIKMTVTYPDGTVKEKTFDYTEGVDAEINGTAKEVSYVVPKLAETDANIPDGTYKVQVQAFDLAGNSVTSDTKNFRVDTTKPVVTAKINSGTVSTKDAYYYKSNVTVALTYSDANPDLSSIQVIDGDDPVNVTWSTSPDANGNYTATYTASAETAHTVKITAKDAASNEAISAQESFKIDKTLPTLSTTVNGLVYTDNTGLLYMTNNVTLNASVNDTNEDRGDLNYQLILTKPDQETVTNLYQKTTDRSFAYTEEGEYTINLFAVDKANNQSSIRSIRFRIDKAAPNLSINGVGSGSSADSVTVSCVMQESFWRDAEGTITIYSRAGDGVPEVLLKTINVTPTSASTVISETFTETGVYRIEFTASDRAGHTSETSTQFTIDREAPVVTLEGPENYAKTKDEVPIAITVVDDFYLQKKVNLVATRTDDTGKVHDLDFGTWNEGGNPTNIAGTFAEDGIYDISITATDMAGNSDSKSVHFTIDKSAPVIGDLSHLDDQILPSFSWDEDLDELVSDLTVCDVEMYLNGSVYDGESEIEDGAYTLLIVAEDELGNKTEKEVTFVLDTKVPVFIVTGVEEDEVKNEEYSISVSLQLEEDTLTSVTLNGKEMYSGDSNVCSFTVSEKGEYKLVMSATDAAGNTASYELEFKYGEDSMWWLWLIIAIAVLLVSGIVLIVIKKKNNDK